MSEKTKKLLLEFYSLSIAEKNEFFSDLRKLHPMREQRGVGMEQFGKANSINFGPKGEPCPLCNR